MRWLLVVLAACGRVAFDPIDDVAISPTCTPGAAEQCDGFDNDCNGATDEGCPCTERVDTFDLLGLTVGVAWSGAGYGVVQLDDITELAYFTYVDARGIAPKVALPIMPKDAGVARANSAVGIGWTGSRVIAVLQDFVADNVRVAAHRLRLDGAVEGTSVLDMGSSPVLAPRASGLAIVYYASSTAIGAAVVDELGVVVRDVALQAPAGAFPRAAAASASEIAVSTLEKPFDVSQLTIHRFDLPTGARIGAPTLAGAGRATAQQAMAWNGRAYAITWIEETPAANQVWFAEITGGVLGTPVLLASGLVGYPDVAWNGAHWVAAYQRYNQTDFRPVTVVAALMPSGERVRMDREFTDESSGELYPSTRLAVADRRAAVVFPISVESQNTYRVAQLCE